MKINIIGLNKAKILVALFENAKKSKWTEATIGNTMCQDASVRSMMSDIYQPRINDEIKKLELTEDAATQLLSSCSSIDYVGPVLISIDFSTDIIDTNIYDRNNHKNGGCKSAEDVIYEQFGVKLFAHASRKTHYSSYSSLFISTVSSDTNSQKALDIATQESLQALLNPACKLYNLPFIGISVELPLGTSMSELTSYAELLKNIGIVVKIKPESTIAGIMAIAAKLEIQHETLESFSSKVKNLHVLATESSEVRGPHLNAS